MEQIVKEEISQLNMEGEDQSVVPQVIEGFWRGKLQFWFEFVHEGDTNEVCILGLFWF